MEILGRRLCSYCAGLKETLGRVNEEDVVISLELREVVSVEREFLVLDCGHRLHKLQPFLSNQEWLRDYPKATGEFQNLGRAR
jgi:hypothetical protein